ncbi:PREDICTED: E3 ubiquitin-protein ligase Topors-like [Chinchilla lanigera]|uniref:E3 ubiquitin-protein ligase Topors-like n=1 Tax=Chinchilla lanigera TaxID=34839 RepID=UPI00038EDA98|nr:PREDICTED: E3 ubiquitin-protein ligase Topors-like [Chinchilla lanigera]
MALEVSSDCECPNCLEDAESEPDWNFYSKIRKNGSLHSGSRKKPLPPFGIWSYPPQCGLTRPKSDKEDSAFVAAEEEESVGFSQKNYLRLSPEGIRRKIKPSGELTIQDLLRDFGVTGKFQPISMSLGHFRDHVVMKFRRALYYSGIWVSHVQGYGCAKNLSAKYFQNNPGSLHRLVPWLKRELRAVYGDYGYTVKNILAAILHHMTKYDLDSEAFVHLLEPYLLQHTHHFLHEFISFVHSPYNMKTYDQRAIYQCPSVSTWVKKESVALGPILPLPKEHNLMMSQHDKKQSEDNQGQWNKEGRSESHLKPFPNGNSSLRHSEVPLVNHKTASKIHDWTKAKAESSNQKGTISPDNVLLSWATQRKSGPGMLNCKKHIQEKDTEWIKLYPGHIQDLKKTEPVAHTFHTPEISNSVQQQKYNLRERKVLHIGPQTNLQKKQIENTKYSDSSPKVFQRLSRERALINWKPRKRDPSCSCISESTLFPTRHGRKLSSFREKISICRPSSQFIEGGSHHSRGIQRQGRSSTQRSKSWCVGHRRRSEGRESSNLSLEISHRCGPFTENTACGSPKEMNVRSQESNYKRASLTPSQCLKLSSTAGKRPKCPSKGEGAFQTESPCNSSPCLHIVKQRSPSKGEMKQKAAFSRARKTRGVSHRKNKSQHSDIQTTEEIGDESGDLEDTGPKKEFF